MYALHYNGNFLFENFIHCFWRNTITNFVHFTSKGMYIVMVDRDRINVLQKFFKILKFIVIYIILNYDHVIY